MGRKILVVFLLIMSFLLLFLGWNMFEKYKLSQVYNQLEENIIITDEERISVEKISEVHENGVNSLVAMDFKNEAVQIINNRLQSNLKTDQITLKHYETFIDISFKSNGEISFLYRYYLDGHVTKITSIEKYNKIYMTSCNDDNSMKRSLDIDKSLIGNGLRFVFYCLGSGLIFIILGILVSEKPQYKDYYTGELIDIKDFSQTKGRIKNLIIGGIIIILPVVAIIYFYTLYDPQFIPNRIDEIVEHNSYIFDEERLPLELITSTINDYADEINKQPDHNLSFSFWNLKEDQVISENLLKLIDKFVSAENSVLGYKLTQNDINVHITSDYISLHYFWEHVSYYFNFHKDGYIYKDLDLSDKDITYKLYNSNNSFIQLQKKIPPDNYTSWSILFYSWFCAYICIAFGIHISNSKKLKRYWNTKEMKYMDLYDYNYYKLPIISFISYGTILFTVGGLAYLFKLGSTVTLSLIGVVAGIAYFEYFRSTNRKLFLIVGTVLILPLLILSVIWIQREIKWIDTRREMDAMEHEILKKIVITDNEKLPAEILEAFYSDIMTNETEAEDQLNPAFEALTEEFLQRINNQLKTSLKPEDLKEHGFISKSDIEKYGDEVNLVYYQFVIGEDTYNYRYYSNNRITKTIDRGTPRINRVCIINENNESLNAAYSDWKSKFGGYLSETISMYDYYKFMKVWEKSTLSEREYITIDNIQN